uniref:Uncharacterized protein n=1 Tax=Micrurus lemniscatus lemniscatus TaxID=129467 RepID=A0A2D4HGS4_MICLE
MVFNNYVSILLSCKYSTIQIYSCYCMLFQKIYFLPTEEHRFVLETSVQYKIEVHFPNFVNCHFLYLFKQNSINLAFFLLSREKINSIPQLPDTDAVFTNLFLNKSSSYSMSKSHPYFNISSIRAIRYVALPLSTF